LPTKKTARDSGFSYSIRFDKERRTSMDARTRREYILETIGTREKPVSATSLAKELNVSRQVIVGDVSLLRAGGYDIIATARGYMIPKHNDANKYFAKVACQHESKSAADELYTIVDLGAVVVNVIVEHGVYGEITGSLNLASRKEVDAFISKVNSSEVKLLSELTMGAHLHTIACRDKAHFDAVYWALKDGGFLYNSV